MTLISFALKKIYSLYPVFRMFWNVAIQPSDFEEVPFFFRSYWYQASLSTLSCLATIEVTDVLSITPRDILHFMPLFRPELRLPDKFVEKHRIASVEFFNRC